MQSLAERVGRVDLSAGFVLREIRREQWSFLNIPLMWAASAGDRSCAVLQWLADSAQNVSISVGGDSMSGCDDAGVGHSIPRRVVRMGPRTPISVGEFRSVL